MTNLIDHAHPQLEMNLIVAGKGAYFTPEGQHELVPGTLVWLLPGQQHRLLRTPELDMWVAMFAREDVDADLLSDVTSRPLRLLSSEDAIALDRLLSSINQDTDEPSLYQAGMRYALRSAWHYTMTSPGPARKPMHPAVLQALAVLRRSEDPPSTAELARRCGVAKKYLGQLLVEHTGHGFVEWRNRVRLERFHHIYPKTEDLLSAALEAGFGSYAQFHRVFLDLVDMTPGAWAKSGGRPLPMAMPSEAAPIGGSTAGSTRMAWYPLSEQPLESISRWFPNDFGDYFFQSNYSAVEKPAVSEGLAISAFKQFEKNYFNEISSQDSALGERLLRIQTRFDIFEEYQNMVEPYGLDMSDLIVHICIYICYAAAVTRRLPNPSRPQIAHVISIMRGAISSKNLFNSATYEELCELAGAIVYQTMFLTAAMEGSRASGSDIIVNRVSTAARSTALASIRIDPLHLPLIRP